MALFIWKIRLEVTIYECGNGNCPHRVQNLNKLNAAERILRKKRYSQFKLCYHYREYHCKPHQIQHSAPLKPKVDITRIHVADNRGALPAINEAIRTAKTDHKLNLVTDDNPSYTAAVLYLNTQQNNNSAISHHKVIGLQNLNEQSEQFRPFKQLIEHLNRTYKQHIRPSHGFNTPNGVCLALTTLFVTHYSFLRPHMALKYKTPVQILELNSISTIQGKWAKILSIAA